MVFALAGLVAYTGERVGFFEFNGLPEWVRPACLITWIVASIHVSVRLIMASAAAFHAASRFALAIPQRRRQRVADRQVIDRLVKMRGLAREVLCYARYREENHIWTDDGGGYRWLNQLREAGLVELTNANFRSAHYEIHRVAWAHMNRFPNQFVHVLAWRNPPWSERFDERLAEREIERRESETESRANHVAPLVARFKHSLRRFYRHGGGEAVS